jgi:hypothetical protein
VLTLGVIELLGFVIVAKRDFMEMNVIAQENVIPEDAIVLELVIPVVMVSLVKIV